MRGRRHSTRSRAWHVVWGGEGRGGGLGSAIYPLLCAVTTAWIEKWLSHGAISRPPRWCGPWPQWRPSPSFVQTLGQICSIASWSKILEQFSPRMLYGANLMHTISSPQFGIFAKCFKYFDIKNCHKKNCGRSPVIHFTVSSVQCATLLGAALDTHSHLSPGGGAAVCRAGAMLRGTLLLLFATPSSLSSSG